MFELVINFTVPLKLFLAIICGYFIGYERAKNDKPGGTRTFGLVSLGGAIIGVLTLKLANLDFDSNIMLNLSRLASYAIAGIGFIGSGVIIQNKKGIEGITTAATLFVTVPIGLCFGFGFYFLGIVSTLLIYGLLSIKHLERKQVNKRRS